MNVLLLLRCCMPVVGIFSCEVVLFLDVGTFGGERLRRIGVRKGELSFRCIVGLLCFVLCRWLSLLDCQCFCVVKYQRFNSYLKCSMWNMALFPRRTLARVAMVPRKTSSVTSYCDVVSLAMSSVSGVTE